MLKLFKKTCKSLLLIVTVFSFASCSNNNDTSNNKKVYRTLEEIKESGTINIGVYTDSPFGYIDEYGELQGYDIYFAKRIAKDIGVEINFISTESASRIEYLKTGKVDVILANFTKTAERAKEVDFALPYMRVSLGLASFSDNVITSLEDFKAEDQIIVTSGTTAHAYLEKNYPNITLKKYDSLASAITAFENKEAVAWANDNTEVIAFTNGKEGYVVSIPSFGGNDTINPAVSQGNESLLNWLNEEIVKLGEENFFHKNYYETLLDTYGADYLEEIVVEGGEIN